MTDEMEASKISMIIGADEEEPKTEDDCEDEVDNDMNGYLDRLCCLGLDDLKTELVILSNTRDKLQDNLQEAASSHSRNFALVFQTRSSARQTVETVSKTCQHQLPDKISTLCDFISSFSDSVQSITWKWKTASVMLKKHQQIQEFLELPALMESCVKIGCYDEALKLFLHAAKVHSKNPKIPLINKVYEDTVRIRDALTVTLLNELKQPCQLPSCMKLVSLIKKLEVFDDIEIRIKFLSCRDSFLDSVFKGIPTSPPLMHLTRFIDAAKVNLFDIATQFKAIFPSSSSVGSPSNEFEVCEGKILSSWLLHRVDYVVAVIQDDLISCIESEPFYPIDDMIDPCFYLGLSLSRIGCDIRPRIMKIFNTTLLRRLTRVLGRASNAFDKELNQLDWKKVLKDVKVYDDDVKEDEDAVHPPMVLLHVIPLARLLNGILSALNEIHVHSASLLVTPNRVRDALADTLVRSTEVILAFCRRIQSQARQEPDIKNSRDFCTKLCTLYCQLLIPHVTDVLSVVFPSSSLAKSLGVSAVDFNRLTKTIQEKEGVIMSEEDDDHHLSFGINYLMQVNAKAYLLDNYLPKLDLLRDEEEAAVDIAKHFVNRSKDNAKQASLEEELMSCLKSSDLPESSSKSADSEIIPQVKQEDSTIITEKDVLTKEDGSMSKETISQEEPFSSRIEAKNTEKVIDLQDVISIVVNPSDEESGREQTEKQTEITKDDVERDMKTDNDDKQGVIEEKETEKMAESVVDDKSMMSLLPNQKDHQDKSNEKDCLETHEEDENLAWDDWGDDDRQEDKKEDTQEESRDGQDKRKDDKED